MLSWIKLLVFGFEKKQKVCTHDLNYVVYTYTDNNGIPMMLVRCRDCGKTSHEQVSIENIPEDWEEMLIVSGGKVINGGEQHQVHGH